MIGVTHESKVGYTSLTKSVKRQIAKDAEILLTGQVKTVKWTFFERPTTGKADYFKGRPSFSKKMLAAHRSLEEPS